MFEKIVGLERMTIHQCEQLAQDVGYEGATFDLVGPLGRKSCTWLDAYMGIFQIEGMPGFMMASDPRISFAKDLWCENLMPPPGKGASRE